MTSVELQLSPPTTELVSNLKTVCQREGYGFSDEHISLIASAIAGMTTLEPCDQLKASGDIAAQTFLLTWLELLAENGVNSITLSWMQEVYQQGWGSDNGKP